MKWTEMNNLTRQTCIKACIENKITYKEMEKAWHCGNGTVKSWYDDNKDRDFSELELGAKLVKKSVKDICVAILGKKYEDD